MWQDLFTVAVVVQLILAYGFLFIRKGPWFQLAMATLIAIGGAFAGVETGASLAGAGSASASLVAQAITVFASVMAGALASAAITEIRLQLRSPAPKPPAG